MQSTTKRPHNMTQNGGAPARGGGIKNFHVMEVEGVERNLKMVNEFTMWISTAQKGSAPAGGSIKRVHIADVEGAVALPVDTDAPAHCRLSPRRRLACETARVGIRRECVNPPVCDGIQKAARLGAEQLRNT